jgi:hypothetical protein
MHVSVRCMHGVHVGFVFSPGNSIIVLAMAGLCL